MKLSRTKIFISISSVSLLLVLIIQLNWILQTAKIKEALFNEKANLVLSRTTEALGSDKETCKKIGDCIENESSTESTAQLGKDEVYKIDSLFNYYLKFYNFHIEYSFVLSKPKYITSKSDRGFGNYTFNKPLQDITGSNIELKLIFPEKRHFIIAELGGLFITSVILILVVLVLFWQTVKSLLKEKKISEHTTDFLNNMTHEFKTPLTNIALASNMITKDSNINQVDKVKHYSGIIRDENEKLRLQVEQVLNMTALERGEIPLHKIEIDVHHLINEALTSINLQIENRQGSLKLNLCAVKYMVAGDKTHLLNVLLNLIDNAIKYSKGKPELLIQSRNNGENLIVEISDKGIGINKEYQNKVFEKFFRVPTGDVHDVKGFGLGLAYVKKIIELHGGSIELYSENGTVFTIILPNV